VKIDQKMLNFDKNMTKIGKNLINMQKVLPKNDDF
jgi:hypothetical protein